MPNHTSLVIKDEEVFKKVREIAFREGKDVSELTFEMYEKYIKEHGDGNPIYSLEKWTENPEFMATPAFFSKADRIKAYFSKLTENEANEHFYKVAEWKNAYKLRFGVEP